MPQEAGNCCKHIPLQQAHGNKEQSHCLQFQTIIAFEGKTKYGYGVCIDDVLVSGSNAGTEEYHNSKMYVYPNPTHGIVNIVFSDHQSEMCGVTVTDINGAVVYEGNSISQKDVHTIDLGFLSKGMYFVHCQSSGGQFVKKIIIQ